MRPADPEDIANEGELEDGPQKEMWRREQKPVKLLVELILRFTKPGMYNYYFNPILATNFLVIRIGDLVVDPFAGTGSTGAACIQLERDFLGLERDSEMTAAARERLNDDRNLYMETGLVKGMDVSSHHFSVPFNRSFLQFNRVMIS